jgi:hypothetical protein
MGTPTGRPPTLDKVVHVRPDGTEITAAQQVLERIRLGLTYEEAADTTPVSRQTIHNWRLAGARARAAIAADPTYQPTATEARYMAFLDDLESAHAQSHLERLAVIQRATLPYTVTKTVERREVDKEGNQRVVEITTTSEQRPGSWQPAAWWLERRIPAKYARRVELSGPEGGPIPVEQRAEALAGQLRDYLQGVEDAAKQDA